MYKYNSSPYINFKSKVTNYTSKKSQCIKLEKDIFNYINLVRQNPCKIIDFFQNMPIDPDNNNNNYETQQIFNFILNLTKNNISLPPLIENQELNKISYDLLNYLINIKKFGGKIKYNNLDQEYINLRLRAAPYGRIRGKYYEAIVLDSKDLLEIISYIMKDIKGRNVLFNEKIKYIGIACGFFENINNDNNIYYKNNNSNKICTIIDMVQDFELNDISINNDTNYNINNQYKNKTPELLMRLKPVFNDKDKDKYIYINDDEDSNSMERKPKSTDRLKRSNRLTKHSYNENNNKSFDTKKIIVNKTPLLTHNKNFTTTYSNFYNRESNTNKYKGPIASFKTSIKNQKLSSLKKIKNNSNKNTYKNNSDFYSSQYNFNKKKIYDKYTNDDLSDKNDANSSYISQAKNSKKKLNREEKIELLKKLNKASRDKSNKKKKTKSNLKS